MHTTRQELSGGTANTLASIGHSFAFTKWLKVLNFPCLTHICFAVKYLYYKLAPQSIVFCWSCDIKDTTVVSISLGAAVYPEAVTSSVIMTRSLGQTWLVNYIRRENKSLSAICYRGHNTASQHCAFRFLFITLHTQQWQTCSGISYFLFSSLEDGCQVLSQSLIEFS